MPLTDYIVLARNNDGYWIEGPTVAPVSALMALDSLPPEPKPVEAPAAA
jgi:hypothetical protein